MRVGVRARVRVAGCALWRGVSPSARFSRSWCTRPSTWCGWSSGTATRPLHDGALGCTCNRCIVGGSSRHGHLECAPWCRVVDLLNRWVLRQISYLVTTPGVVILVVLSIIKLLRTVCRWLVFPGSTSYVTGQIDSELAKRTKRRMELGVSRSIELLQVRVCACVCMLSSISPASVWRILFVGVYHQPACWRILFVGVLSAVNPVGCLKQQACSMCVLAGAGLRL